MSASAPRRLRDLLARLDARRGPFCASRGAAFDGAGFAARARELGRRFRAAGVRPQDRVAAYLEHGPDAALLPFACAEAGAIAVIVNPRLRDAQVEHVIHDCEPALVWTSTAKSVALLDPARAFGDARVVVDEAEPPPWATRLTAEERTGEGNDDPDAPAILLYTSGSTGRPKGIVQTQRSLCDGARIVAGYLGLCADDHLAAVLPLSFDYGLNQVLSAAYAGARVTLTSYLTAGELLRTLAQHGCTGLAGVPEIWLDVVAALEAGAVSPTALHALRYVTNSGGRLPERVIRSFHARLPHVQVFAMYGLTEAFRSSFVPPHELAARPRSIGRAMPEVTLLVVDPATGREVAHGEVGELVHCGACVARGYWNRDADTAERFRPDPRPGAGGALAVWSGDLVRRDAEGWLEIVGRRDAQLKIGGYRVSPDEVVDAVRAIAGVHSAAALGVPRGEDGLVALAVAVVPTQGVADPRRLADLVRSECQRTLPPWLVPALVRVVETLPRTPNDKIDLSALRAVFAAGDA
ncbi:MAG: AMP-binding protein [Planctomycetes bacterium]|nr:AMP-binding protein [Planctomycetota bacterium]